MVIGRFCHSMRTKKQLKAISVSAHVCIEVQLEIVFVTFVTLPQMTDRIGLSLQSLQH